MKSLIVALMIVAGASMALAAVVTAEPFPPAKFTNLYLERDEKGSTVTVQSQGDDVTFKITMGKNVLESRTVHPGPDDWFKFIQALNAAKVYNWAPRYMYPGQGPSWVIDFTMNDRKFYSEGTNEFPLEGDVAQPQANPLSGPSVPFQLYWQAVLALVGKVPPAAGASK
jgi:hypothetical protein